MEEKTLQPSAEGKKKPQITNAKTTVKRETTKKTSAK